jgi:hypothetical protein
MRRIRIIRNEILKSDMFRKLGALKSSAKLLGLGFVFAGDDGSATIGVIMLITEGLGVVVEF